MAATAIANYNDYGIKNDISYCPGDVIDDCCSVSTADGMLSSSRDRMEDQRQRSTFSAKILAHRNNCVGDNKKTNYDRKRRKKLAFDDIRSCKLSIIVMPLSRIMLILCGLQLICAASTTTVMPNGGSNDSHIILNSTNESVITPARTSTVNIQPSSPIANDTVPEARASELSGNSSGQSDFSTDCTDPNFPEIRCHAQYADCSMSNGETNAAALAYANSHGNTANTAPHDVRIDRFAKALARRHNSERHKLTVSVSWQTPSHNITRYLSGFSMEIATVNSTQPPHCFYFNVSGSNWTQEIVMSSPRLRFTSFGFFQFANTYDVTVRTLPSAEVRQRFITPADPNDERAVPPAAHDGQTGNESGRANNGDAPLPAQNCSKFSHEFASQWTAGFRRIVLHTLAKMIQVEFVGAPPQYCFEQYEVRLLDETATEMLHSGIVNVHEMHTEQIDNATVYFGEFNFTNLELDRVYVPSLIPVEKAADGRCLCPVNSVDPYDTKTICSCVAADWKPIRLSRFDIVQTDTNNLNTSAFPSLVGASPEEFTNYWPHIFAVNAIILLLFVCAFFFIAHLCQQHNRTGRIRFIKSVNGGAGAVAFGAGGDSASAAMPKQNGVGLYFEPADSASQMPLILEKKSATNGGLLTLLPTSVLIVYAHDCHEHDACVEALAILLREVFGLQVALDVWDEESIECSIADYLSASVVNADKVIVINSIGASYRFQAKIAPAASGGTANGSQRFIVERTTGGRFDNIFLPQLDMALQHPSIVSARFAGTAITHVIPTLNDRLQYVLPSNIAQFIGALIDANLKQDPRLNHPLAARFDECARQFGAMACADPDWFVRTHRRRVVHDVASPRLVAPSLAFVDVLPEAADNDVSTPELEMTAVRSDTPETTGVAVTTEPADSPSPSVASPLTQRVHVQVIRDEQPSTTISFDSGLVATMASDSISAQLPTAAIPITIDVPQVTVIPASPMSASPLSWSPAPAVTAVKLYDNDVASDFLSSPSQEDDAEQSQLEEQAMDDHEMSTTAPDSGVFTETLDFGTQSVSQLPPKPTVHVMITQQTDLKDTCNNADNGIKILLNDHGNDTTLNGHINGKHSAEEDIVVRRAAKRHRHKNKRNNANNTATAKMIPRSQLNEEFQDSGMIDEDLDQQQQSQRQQRIQSRRHINPS